MSLADPGHYTSLRIKGLGQGFLFLIPDTLTDFQRLPGLPTGSTSRLFIQYFREKNTSLPFVGFLKGNFRGYLQADYTENRYILPRRSLNEFNENFTRSWKGQANVGKSFLLSPHSA